MDEADLLDRIRKSPESFGELFKLYYQPIFGYIIRRTGSFDDTADIAADTFFKAFQHIHKFKYTSIAVKVWLYRIATNEVNLYFRHKQKYNSIFERIGFEDRKIFEGYMDEDRKEIEAELQRHEQFLIIQMELKKLPIKYQEVIALRYFEGKENKEIIEILDINEGTLKSLLSRGLKKLRQNCNQI
jgi:RNA polymerase sigma-70 factor (ECF subfamily)